MAGRMASLNANQRIVLTKCAWGYKNAAHIWKDACQSVPVDKTKVTVPKFGLEEFRHYDTSRGTHDDSNVVQKEALTNQDINLKEYELSYPIGVVESNEAFFSEEKRGASVTNQGTSLDIEIDIAALFGTQANFASGNYETLAGTDQWTDYTDSDPQAKIEAAKAVVRGKIGVNPNSAVIPDVVYRTLIRHSKLIELFKYSRPGILKLEHLKDIFELENIYIGGATYAANGATTLTDVYDDFFTLYYQPSKTPKKKEDIVEPAFCYNFMLKGYPKVYGYEAENKKTNYINTTHWCKPTIVSDVAGYLFLDCNG